MSGPGASPLGFDATLRLRSAFNRGLLSLARTRAGRWYINSSLRAAHPHIALAAGAELLSRPRNVLALTAHPDDLEFFAGGVLKRLSQSGSKIHAWVLSDGEKHGGHARMGDIRQGEQSSAASLQGFASVHFAGLPDFALPEDPRLERVVAEAWKKHKPDTVLAFDPQELIARMANRDHKALGRTVMDLARAHFDTNARVYFYGTRHPNVLIDIDPVFEEKMRAVECHTSQLVYLTRREYREGFALMAEAYAHGTPCRFAEGLYRLV